MRSNKQQHEQQLKEQQQQLEVQWEINAAHLSAQHKQVCEELKAGYEQQLHQLQAEFELQVQAKDTLQQQLCCAHARVQQLQQELATATAAHDQAAGAAAALRCELTSAQQAAEVSSAEAAAATQEAAASKQQLAEAQQQLSQERAAVLSAQAATKDSSAALDAAHQRLQQVSVEVGRLQRANEELKQQLQRQQEQAAAEHAAWQATSTAWQQQQAAGLQALSSRLLAVAGTTHSAVAAAEGADAASAAAGSAISMLAGNIAGNTVRQQQSAAAAAPTTCSATASPQVNATSSATRQRHPGAAAVVDGPFQQHKGSEQHQQQRQGPVQEAVSWPTTKTDVTAATCTHTQPLAPLAALQFSSRSTSLSSRDSSSGSSLSTLVVSTGSNLCTPSSSGRSSSSSSSSASPRASASRCTALHPLLYIPLRPVSSSVVANMRAVTNWRARLQTARDMFMILMLDAEVDFYTAREIVNGLAAPATDLQQRGAVELLLLSCMETAHLKKVMELQFPVNSLSDVIGVVAAELVAAWQRGQQEEQAKSAAAVPAALAATAALVQQHDACSSSSSTNKCVNGVRLLNRGSVMCRDGLQRATDSCYLNSVVQLLHMSGCFKVLLEASARAPALPPSSTAGCLLAVAAALQQRSTKQLDLVDLRRALQVQNPTDMEEGRQNDSEAAFVHILKSFTAHSRVSTTAGSADATGSCWDVVAGCVVTHKPACARCNRTGEVFAASMLHDLRLAWLDASKQPLAQLLREQSERSEAFQKYSKLVGVCPDCGCMESLCTEVVRTPPFLAVHCYSQPLEAPGAIAAVTAQLGDERLELSDWMPCSSQAATAGNSSSSSYSLAGVCLRRRLDLTSGHYVALLRLPHAAASPGSSKWVLLDDAAEPKAYDSWQQAWQDLIEKRSWVPTTLLVQQGGPQPPAAQQKDKGRQQQQQAVCCCVGVQAGSGVESCDDAAAHSWVQVAGRKKGKRS